MDMFRNFVVSVAGGLVTALALALVNRPAVVVAVGGLVVCAVLLAGTSGPVMARVARARRLSGPLWIARHGSSKYRNDLPPRVGLFLDATGPGDDQRIGLVAGCTVRHRELKWVVAWPMGSDGSATFLLPEHFDGQQGQLPPGQFTVQWSILRGNRLVAWCADEFSIGRDGGITNRDRDDRVLAEPAFSRRVLPS